MTFPDFARGKQGICIPVAAFCFSLIMHPNKWSVDTIDQVLQAGTDLYIDSIKNLHMHEETRELLPADLAKYCYVGKMF